MKRIIIIIISFLAIGMYSFRNSILNVHDNAPDDFDLNSYNDLLLNITNPNKPVKIEIPSSD